jgi:hypothetical protein
MSFSMSRPSWRQAATVLLALSAAIVTACGGGGDGGTATTAGTTERATAYAAGPISGFGSVIVNGVRYDDSAASVSDDDDRAGSREQLKLGMMVEVDGAAVAGGLGRALRIRFGSEIVGPVSAVDTAAATLVVLGQTVEIKDTTVFDSGITGGLGGIAVGTVLEVHAQYNAATGRYVATRIEVEDDASTYKLRGLVSRLDAAAKTFRIGSEVISYAGVTELPANLADGLRVRVRLQTTQVNGQWVATAVRTGVRKVDDRSEGHVRGTITVFKSTADFEVNGLMVNATNAAFPDGLAGVALGAMVEVEGAIVDGVLVATKVELDGRHADDRHRFELHGLISGLDTTAKTFVLRGVKVSYGGTGVVWKDGSEASLANGKKVEVKGTPSADRTSLVATSIEFEG